MIDHEGTPLQEFLDNSQEKNSISHETFNGYKNKLKGRLYGLLCEREKGGKWEAFLEALTIELMGNGANCINWWPLIGKVNMLKYLSYDYFRKTIFECMNLVGNLDMPYELH